MALPFWSVRFAVETVDAGPISGVMQAAMGEGVRSIQIHEPPLQEGDDEPDAFTLELEAATAEDARQVAREKLADLRARAELPSLDSAVLWVARLSDEPASSLRFLAKSEDLVRDEEYALAVVAAQIHLEVQVRILVESVAEVSASPVLEAVIARQSRWAPHERWLQPILEALFEIRFADCPSWGAYKDHHITRRNHVVHEGQEVDRAAAVASIEVVSAVWLWLNEANAGSASA